jgi:hypothetical protein
MELVLNDQQYVAGKMEGLSDHLRKFELTTLGQQMVAQYQKILN